MKATELRIGNWIQKEDNTYEVISVSEAIHGLNVVNANNNEGFCITAEFAKGIQLTEEWLLKFGFEKDNTHYLWRTSLLCLDSFANKNGIYFQTIEIKYVHQLQNLYFALTGEELC